MAALGATFLLIVFYLALVVLCHHFISALGGWLESFLSAAGVIILLVVVGIIWAIFDSAMSPDLATLKKSEWECVSTHKEHRLVGKIFMDVDVCDTYQMKTAH